MVAAVITGDHRPGGGDRCGGCYSVDGGGGGSNGDGDDHGGDIDNKSGALVLPPLRLRLRVRLRAGPPTRTCKTQPCYAAGFFLGLLLPLLLALRRASWPHCRKPLSPVSQQKNERSEHDYALIDYDA